MVVGIERRVEIQGRARFIRFGSRGGVGLSGVDENIFQVLMSHGSDSRRFIPDTC